MALTVTNTSSLNAQRNLARSSSELDRVIERLSSGSRINSARDDSAGLAISTRLTSQIRGLGQAVRNTNDGISLAQTADSALNDISSGILRIRELAVQAANDVNSDDDRSALQSEVTAIVSEISRIADETQFNGRKPIGGGSQVTFLHLGPNARESLGVVPIDARASRLGSHVRVQGTTVNPANPLAYGELQINGYSVRGTVTADDAESTANGSGSAIAVAAAINDLQTYSAVRAIAVRTTVTGGAAVAAGALDDTDFISLNGSQVSGITVDVGDATGTLVGAINALTEDTGIIASIDDQRRLVLTAEDGRNIEVTTSTAAAAGTTGLNAGAAATNTTGGAVIIESDKAVRLVVGTANAATTSGFGGGAAGTYTLGIDGTNALKTVDVSTRDGANRTIDIADAALRQVATQRAGFGALTNRLETAVNNLTVRGENLSAARSRITDADFAAETAALARTSFMRDAGLSVLAQANVSSKAALSLLS